MRLYAMQLSRRSYSKMVALAIDKAYYQFTIHTLAEHAHTSAMDPQ